jgi:hypothetical protein
MLQVTEKELERRLTFDNPWWGEGGKVPSFYQDLPHRDHFDPFLDQVSNRKLRRAVVLMGPRRVGKTVMLYQTVQRLLEQGVRRRAILYAPLDNPVYMGLALEKMLHMLSEAAEEKDERSVEYVFFDEIQYLKDWEIHLKSLVDSYPDIKFVVSGSAAAALRMKSIESGAGRFTDILLPPLSFKEYLMFQNINIGNAYNITDNYLNELQEVNRHFLDFLNFGGFPEAVMEEHVRRDLGQFVGRDVIDKVLLRDLPSLYGITNSQELNRFFAAIAYNTGLETSYEALSQQTGIAKNTVRKFIEYLEAAYLIRILHRLDQSATRLKRVRNFKIYLTNASIRSALFGPPAEGDPALGRLVETAVIAEFGTLYGWSNIFYARWGDKEIDIVLKAKDLNSVDSCYEIKWRNNSSKNNSDLARLNSIVDEFAPNSERYLFCQSAKLTADFDEKNSAIKPLTLYLEIMGDVKRDKLVGKPNSLNPKSFTPYKSSSASSRRRP